MPCWYEISWRPEIGVILRIHTDFASTIKPIPQDAQIVQHFKGNFGFKKFGAKFGKDFGFENSLKFLGQVGTFLEYHIPASLCRKISRKKCRGCKGSGKDECADKCHYCDGEGKEVYYDYWPAFAVSASLTTLFQLMRFYDIETSSPVPQLICVQTITIADMHGAGVSGEYSQDVVGYLRRRPVGRIPEMIEAMRGVWEKMEGRIPKFYDHSFNAYTQGQGGWLNTMCPGDACGLHPANSYVGMEERGYQFSCHNADNLIQQMAMLASLAALHDLVRLPKV